MLGARPDKQSAVRPAWTRRSWASLAAMVFAAAWLLAWQWPARPARVATRRPAAVASPIASEPQRGDLEKDLPEAQRKVVASREDFARVRAKLSDLMARKPAPPPVIAAPPPQPPAPAPVVAAPPRVRLLDNPAWLEADRQLQERIRRRDQLLETRTPLHPEVQQEEVLIAELTARRDALPRQFAEALPAEVPLPMSPTPVPAPTTPAPPTAEMLAYQAAVKEHARQLTAARELLAAAEKAHLAAIDEEARARRQLEQARAAVKPAPLATPEVAEPHESPWLPSALLAALVALAMAGGVFVLGKGLSADRPIGSVEEARSVLPVPVLGVVPSPRGAGGRKRRGAGGRLVNVACGIGFLAIAAALWAFGGTH